MSLSSIRARVEAATEEEWHAEEIAGEYHIVDGYPFGDSIGEFDREGDAEFAAHAKHDIPLLLKVAEAMREDVKECATWCDEREGCLACHQYARCRKRIVLAELEAAE